MKKTVMTIMVLGLLALPVCAQTVPSGLQQGNNAAWYYGLKKAIFENYKLVEVSEEDEAFIKNVRMLLFSGERGSVGKFSALITRHLSNGGDINATDKYGNTALHWVVIFNQRDFVNVLLSYDGVDVDLKNGANLSALDIARNYRNQGMIELLEQYKEMYGW